MDADVMVCAKVDPNQIALKIVPVIQTAMELDRLRRKDHTAYYWKIMELLSRAVGSTMNSMMWLDANRVHEAEDELCGICCQKSLEALEASERNGQGPE